MLPASCVQPKGNRSWRQRSCATWALRDRRDGRIVQWLPTEATRPHRSLGRALPARDAQAARRLQHALGLRKLTRASLPSHAEPATMRQAGKDRYGRPLWLSAEAGRAWLAMQRAAAREGIRLEAISGFRSVEYQAAIIRRKLKRGLGIEQILAINAAPGESEHHSGRALDMSCPGEPPAEVSFEHTPAFAWLQTKAGHFGFRLSYPRGNPFGIVYEPWHWCWHPPARGSLRQRGGD
nr:M15 family metallopeptidase [Aquimonas voraii]